MTFLLLFWEFLKTGLFSIGGGLATIPFLYDLASSSYGWFTAQDVADMIAISESTPGPIAVNMATFVGSTQAGILGSMAATLGVVLPSFVIILIISMAAKNFMQTEAVQAALKGVRPCVVALILSTALTLALSTLLGLSGSDLELNVDLRAILVFAVVAGASFGYKKLKGKKLSPIIVIVISALMGIILYSL